MLQSSAYVFRPATWQEWRSHCRSPLLGWVMGGLIVGVIVLSLHAALMASMQQWLHHRQTYRLELGTAPLWPSASEWPFLGQRAIAAAVPFLSTAAVLAVLYGMVPWLLSRPPAHYQLWVACHQSTIIGHAILIPTAQYTLLTTLHIAPEHRGQRVGSHLLWHCLQKAQRPVYLICQMQIQQFYRPLGFASVPSLALPPALKQPLAAGALVMKLTVPPTSPTPIVYLPFSPSDKWSVQLLRGIDKRVQVYRRLWKRERFRRSRRRILALIGQTMITPFILVSVVVGILQQLPGLTLLRYFNIPVWGFHISSLALVIWFITLCFLMGWGMVRWQEWVVEMGDRVVAYVHLSTGATCSVLHNLHVEPQYPRPQMVRLLLEYFRHKITFPLYMTCSRRDRHFYLKLGFTRARLQELPPELKIARWHRSMPMKLTYEVAKHLCPDIESHEQPS